MRLHLERLVSSFSAKQLKIMAIALVAVVSFLTHFSFFNRQPTAVFDEVYFGSFAQSYHTKEFNFDIHPPLGKLILAVFAPANDMTKDVRFQSEPYEGKQPNYFRLRLAPSLAGFLLPVILLLVALELGLSKMASTALGLVVAFENALITQSRLILLDSFILLFGFLGLLFYLKFRKKRKYYLLALSGLFLGMTISVKWTALSFLLLVFGACAWDIYKRRKQILAESLKAIACLLIIPLIVYVSVFALHFANQTRSGPGDVFMSVNFQSTLDGNPYSTPENINNVSFNQKFLELNNTMYTSNKSIINDHPYGSKWYSWPIMSRPMWYYVSPDGFSNIYLLGNPVNWWLGSFSVAVLLILMLKKKEYRNNTNAILLIGFLLCWLPFILISRVMFLYHYFPSLVFSMIILIKLIDKLKTKEIVLTTLVIFSFVSYLYFAPLTYGLQLSPDELYQRQLFNSWK